MWVAKCNIGIMTLNPHYLWEAKMLNPYIKHGTFLVEFDDRIKTNLGKLISLNQEQKNFKNKKMIKKKQHTIDVKG